MHILQETTVGYALFRSSPLELEELRRFSDSKDAVDSIEKAASGEVPSGVIELLTKGNVKSLAVSNAKLASAVQTEMEKQGKAPKMVQGEEAESLIKEIHSRLPELLDISEKEMSKLSLLLSHAMCRDRLKLTPQKNDMVIVQTIKVIDKLDKDINNKCMRLREWYGMHFPEIGELVEENSRYLEIVSKHASSEEDLMKDETVPEGVKEALLKTLGGEITQEDRSLIAEAAATVLNMYAAREKLHEHLYSRMADIAPNLLELLGSLMGARIIAQAGSLTELARKPASTIQMMGAEKALFKAMKEKKNTPKYGIVYNSTYVGQAPLEIKGQVARTLASKIAIASRCDASGEEASGDYGIKAREDIEKRVAALSQKKNASKKMQLAQTNKFAMKRPSAAQESFKKKKY
ncbi:nucleolar protein 58 [Nematocida major]|uniref:nucleolar protein 58 n=1 Tax=Nematocida major TaxID=1912982 RepID=UPI0020074317|nr:nucleolar protein 58 [Nematocida major]KAH9386473.1 nucleolar protein 58 [Nematocida major]